MRARGFNPSRNILKRRIILITICIVVIIAMRYLYLYGKEKALNIVPKDGNMKFTIEFCSADLIQNSSVGNNWSFESNVNGKRIKEGRKTNIKATINDKITFTSSAKEHDFVSDIGTGTISVTIRELNLPEKNIYPLEVIVAENRGKYLGNTAKWKFVFSVNRKVSLSDIIRNIF